MAVFLQQDSDSGEGSKIENVRKVSYIRITLSTDCTVLGQSDADGYQPPLPLHMVVSAPAGKRDGKSIHQDKKR